MNKRIFVRANMRVVRGRKKGKRFEFRVGNGIKGEYLVMYLFFYF